MSSKSKLLEEKRNIQSSPDSPVSQSAYARYAGVTRQTIQGQVKNGVIILTDDGKVIPRQADLARALNAKTSTSTHPDEVAELKIREQRAKTEIAEAKAAAMAGQYVSREQVDDFHFRIVRNARNQFQAMPKNLAHDLGLDHAQQQVMADEIRRILTELDRALKAGE